jgi:hypothetical protein
VIATVVRLAEIAAALLPSPRMGTSLIGFNTTRRWSLDSIGVTASIACAVHCAVVALAMGVMPAAAIIAGSWVEWMFLGLSVAIGLAALLPGYAKHGLASPLVLFTVGISVLLALRAVNASSSWLELSLVLIAAVCLMLAHWKNRGALHGCECGPRHHSHG